MPVFPFFLIFFAYHSDMMLIKGANSNVSGFSLSTPLVTAIKRTLFRLNISVALPAWRSSCPQRGRSFIISVMRITSCASKYVSFTLKIIHSTAHSDVYIKASPQALGPRAWRLALWIGASHHATCTRPLLFLAMALRCGFRMPRHRAPPPVAPSRN